jgi:hypothetical protein
MKIKIFLTVTLILTTLQISFAQDSLRTNKFRVIKQNVFTTGEKLKFEINYGFVTAGYAYMEIAPEYQVINGRKCYDISIKVNSTSSFDWVYKVRDKYVCIFDKEGLFPWRFEQHIREGNYTRDFEVIFDQQNHKVKTFTGIKDPKKPEGEFNVPEYVQDAVSAFYYSRTLDYSKLNVGDKIKLQNFYKNKTFPLDVIYHGKETIDVPAGEFKCIKVEPLVEEGGLFKSEGELIVWLTDDDRKMPVRVKTKVIVGSMNVELIHYEGLAGLLDSKVD